MVILTGHIFCGELNIQVKLIWKEKLKQKSCEPKKSQSNSTSMDQVQKKSPLRTSWIQVLLLRQLFVFVDTDLSFYYHR